MVAKREVALMPEVDSSSRGEEGKDVAPLIDQLHISRGLAHRLQVVSSIFLRLLIYIFLRWIPSSFCTKMVPTLYTIYLFSWLLQRRTVRLSIAHWISHAQLAPAKEQLQILAAKVEVENGEEQGAVVKREPNGAAVEHIAEAAPRSRTQREVKRLSPWEVVKMAIFGHSTRSPKANFISFAAHTLLFAFFLDFLTSPYLFPSHLEHHLGFARVGALSPQSATLHVRFPYPLGHPQDLYRGDTGTTWNALIEEDTAGGSLGGLLRSGADIYSNPEPVRVVYRELISVGATGSDEANLAGSPGSIDGRPRSSPKRWERGPVLRLTEDEDWTATVKLGNLEPGIEYEWRLAFVHNSTFAPMPSRARRFTTWPDPRLSSPGVVEATKATAGKKVRSAPPLDDPNHFSFASSSCVKADFPWVPTQFWAWSWLLRLFGVGDDVGSFSTRNRIPGFDMLASSTLDHRSRPALRFFLQLGDLIYADVPHFGGPSVSAYRKLYRNLFASESFRRVYERLPVIGIYDDHEVQNNWGGTKLVGEESGNDDEEENQVFLVKELESFAPAQQAWKEYVGSANPDPLDAGENYYTFRYGDTAFFVMDTRKHRTPHQLPDDEAKTMLGYKQKEAFLRWLGAVNTTSTFKFVVSSVPFNTLWGGPLDWDGKKDSWAAYTHEREDLLKVMQYIPNIIVLSGDRHEFAAVGVAPQEAREAYHPVTEFSTSPLSMFYLPVRTLDQMHGLGHTGAEKLLKYLPDGNVKWTEFEVDTRNAREPQVHVRVMVDAEEAWKVTIIGSPVHQTKAAIGGVAKTFLELLNWRPRRWF